MHVRARARVVHWHCSAQFSMFNMEKRYRNKIIIIIFIIIICNFILSVAALNEGSRPEWCISSMIYSREHHSQCQEPSYSCLNRSVLEIYTARQSSKGTMTTTRTKQKQTKSFLVRLPFLLLLVCQTETPVSWVKAENEKRILFSFSGESDSTL